ncbi:TraI domain-containing protein [Comamonas sp. w2-DMI]|uniref:TraI domain-containing protein n=1 Tax=Comamonas sp. w2-DMI TaxID=3126391 RepID=UPI0032E4E84D
MSFIKRILGIGKTDGTTAEAGRAPKVQPPRPLVHATYPPRHNGIPIAQVQELLEAQAETIKRLKTHAATLPSNFTNRFEVPLTNLAAYISNIPGSRDSIYGGPGGLFRACVECGFFSFQSSDGKIFTGQLGVEARHLLETRWRYVCFLAGLMYPLGQILEKIRIRDEGGSTWFTRAESITSWAETHGTDSYFISWPKEDVEPGPSVVGGSLALQLVGLEGIRFIEAGSAELITAMTEIASNVRTDFNAIAFDLVAARWASLKKNELSRLPQNYGRVQFGQHIAPLIVDAMRECIAAGKWVVNEQTVLADPNGVYLIWPKAAKDLLESVKLNELKGLPSTPAGLLQAMMDEKMLHIDVQQSAYVDVADVHGELHLAVKLIKPESCIEGYSPNDYRGLVDAQSVAKNDPLVENELATKKAKPKPAKTTKPPEPVSADEEHGTDLTPEPKRVIPDAPPPAPMDLLAATIGISEAVPTGKSPASSTPTPQPPASSTEVIAPAPAAIAPAEIAPTLASVPESTKSAGAAPAKGDGKEPASTPAHQETQGSYMVPDDVEKQLGKALSLMLARIVKEVEKPENKSLLITTQREFVGIPFDAIQEAISSPADFLSAMQKHGWLHPDPKKPRLMVHDLSTTLGGSNKMKYAMFTRGFIKKAQLPF